MTTVLYPEDLMSQMTSAADKAVRKRDGRSAQWDPERIVRAIALAFHAARNKGVDNPHRDNQATHYGLSLSDHAEAMRIASMVTNTVELRAARGVKPSVEEIQDIVEMMIAGAGHFDVAKGYVLYRAKKSEARIAKHGVSGISDYRCGTRTPVDTTCRQRWGDYAAVTIDPSNHRKFYAIGEYASAWAIIPGFTTTECAIWNTYIAEIAMVPEPSQYALMALGLGVIGFAARRRRRQA